LSYTSANRGVVYNCVELCKAFQATICEVLESDETTVTPAE
jgi:hypothetical protein